MKARRRYTNMVFFSFMLTSIACEGTGTFADADASLDVGANADAGVNADTDAMVDASGDADADMSGDANTQAVADAGADASSDVGVDADVEVELKAFPSAYGAGAYTTGGRGHPVYHVTTLADDGAGSLRDALSGSNRTVVFDVSGVIQLSSLLYVDSSNLTIAGQTAPEGGITIDGARVYFSNVDNVIVRHVRFRGGEDETSPSDNGNDSFSSASSITNQIFDHCSFSFDADEAASWYGTREGNVVDNVTIQRSLFGEGLKGSIVGGGADATTGEVSVHHNLFYNVSHRTPNIAGYDGAKIETINNVAWAVSSRLVRSDGNSDWNHINNYYDSGTHGLSDTRLHMQHARDGDPPSIYTSGNVIVASRTIGTVAHTPEEMNADNTLSHRYFLDAEGHLRGSVLEPGYFTDVQHPLLGSPIPILTAEDALADVSTDVGCNARLDEDGGVASNSDALDGGWLGNVVAGTYVDRSPETWSVPAIPSVSRPQGYDTDRDGMPDVWERAQGFDPEDGSDGNGDADADGYTNLEEFLNLVDQ